MTEPSAQRPHRARKGDGPLLRERILQVAMEELVSSERTESLTMRSIAAKVGVTAPALYLHFPTKEDLLFEAAERLAAISVELRKKIGNTGHPLADLLARMGAIIVHAPTYPDVYRTLMMSDSAAAPERFRGDAIFEMAPFQMSLESVRAAIASGDLPSDLDPHMASLLIMFVMHGYMSLRLAKQDMTLPTGNELIEAISRLLVRGLGGDPAIVDLVVGVAVETIDLRPQVG